MKSGVHRWYQSEARQWNEVGSPMLINCPDNDGPTEQARPQVPGGHGPSCT